MKTLVKTLICAAALSVSTISFAGEKKSTADKSSATFNASVYVAKDASIRVAVAKTAPSNVEIVLKNGKNEIVYSNNIDKNALKSSYKLNVDQLEDGEYTLEITSSSKTISKQVQLTSAKIERSIVVE